MIVTPTLRKRFCKDMAVPIALFEEPYFTKRLKTINKVKPCLEDWKEFLQEIERFSSEQEYFEYYNQVKEKAINRLKKNPAFQEFNETEVPKLSRQYSKNNLYSPVNDGKVFISVDMRKANFSALRSFNPDIFDDCDTWEEWISQFTDLQHIIKSKYIRQVIMGTCNPGKQVAYAKHLIDVLYSRLEGIPYLKLLSFESDELVFSVIDNEGNASEYDGFRAEALLNIRKCLEEEGTGIYRVESFRLEMLPEGKGYVKHFFEGKQDEYKCVSAEEFHMIVKERLGLPISDHDRVFRHNGRLAIYFE